VAEGFVDVAVAAAVLLTWNELLILVEPPFVYSITAVIECVPFETARVSYGFAAEAVPPAKSHGAPFSV
jgi:hypothetical protein